MYDEKLKMATVDPAKVVLIQPGSFNDCGMGWFQVGFSRTYDTTTKLIF